ncbi:hypothetical protein GRF29_8g1798412 [Pseudopithomyces chartarum]|uniref:Amidoligase enzyme n=1 Tax=Pseudopithomyces chartarum TaxID=1892770 RepID=A0AAN6RLZ5_9PLEO|nr:hypothetical protein GRF29_8g1798412 [Pseudopithomyces chartarum]
MNPSLTFGVEFEFLCVYERSAFTDNVNYPDLIPDEDQGEFDGYVKASHALWYFMNQANILASGWEPWDAPPVQGYSSWIVDEDESVELDSEESVCMRDGYEQEAIEIASPVLRLGNTQDLAQVQHVLQLLRWMESKFDCIFMTNESCGMHVHVGYGRGNPIPLAISKRIFQLTTAHEHNMDSMHATSRIRAPTVPEGPDRYPLYAPLSFFHRNAKAASKQDNLFDWMRRIEDARTFTDICKFFNIEWGPDVAEKTGHSSAVNFDNLAEDKKTIEFRQHLGTLDDVEVVRYVIFLGYLITYCFQTDEEKFIELLAKATDSAFQITDLMCTIGLPADIAKLFSVSYRVNAHVDSAMTVNPNAPLQALQVLNARKVAENRSPWKSEATKNRKRDLGFYGINKDVAFMPVDAEIVQRMMHQALSRQFGLNPGAELSDICSQSRSVVFGTLAEMYRKGYYSLLSGSN